MRAVDSKDSWPAGFMGHGLESSAHGNRHSQPATPATNPQENLRIRRIRKLQSMVSEFVDRTGGSKGLSALPTGSKWLRALPG